MHPPDGVSECETRQRSVSPPSRPAVLADPVFGCAYPLDPRPCEMRGPQRLPVASRQTSRRLENVSCSFTYAKRAVNKIKSNVVPAPGLEPGRAGFKGRWAANYPTPESEHLALADAAVAATVNPRYRPSRRSGISVPRASSTHSLGRGLRSSACRHREAAQGAQRFSHCRTPVPGLTAWLPQPCRQGCMIAAFMQYEAKCHGVGTPSIPVSWRWHER